METFKIATWNLRHGGGRRINLILNVLEENKAVDVFILTEFRNNQNKIILENGLKELGFDFIQTIDIEAKLNSVLIASKIKFENNLFPNLNEYSHRIIKIQIKGLNIYGCYFPIADLKKYLFDFLLEEIERNGKENIIITGDLNTGKHYLDEKGATFYHSAYLNKIENKGLMDAWRKVHGEKREFTWYSNTGNGFRLDHFFIDNELSEKIVSCEYIHQYRENKISDHSMMILELMVGDSF